MDPKNFAKLDPKLRETYERVMGTSVPQKPTIVPPVSQPSTAQSATPSHIPTATIPVEPLATTTSPATSSPANQSTPLTSPPDAPTTDKTHLHNTIAVHTAVATSHEEKKEEVHEEEHVGVPAWKKILLIVLGIAFFSAYAIFWLLFFKVKLPF